MQPAFSTHDDTQVLVLEGNFDDEAARRLCRMLEGLVGSRVIVDLSRVAQFADRAVAVLAARSEAAVLTFRGVDGHRSQVLRAFRFAVESRPRATDS